MRSTEAEAQGWEHGFSRIELIVILATLALVATVTRPVWASGNATKSLACMDNLRRLSAAWLLYADDNSGLLVSNSGAWSNEGEPPSGYGSWVSGLLDWTTWSGNTNTSHLTESRYSLLAPYSGGDASLFRCPADDYLSAAQAELGWTCRVRSYSMNTFMGVTDPTHQLFADHEYYARLAQMNRLAPARAFVLIEEHPDSINDPVFVHWMRTGPTRWMDLPGSFHDGGAWITCVDGHVEFRRWTNPGTAQPVRFRYQEPPPQPENPDVRWLQERSSEMR